MCALWWWCVHACCGRELKMSSAHSLRSSCSVAWFFPYSNHDSRTPDDSGGNSYVPRKILNPWISVLVKMYRFYHKTWGYWGCQNSYDRLYVEFSAYHVHHEVRQIQSLLNGCERVCVALITGITGDRSAVQLFFSLRFLHSRGTQKCIQQLAQLEFELTKGRN